MVIESPSKIVLWACDGSAGVPGVPGEIEAGRAKVDVDDEHKNGILSVAVTHVTKWLLRNRKKPWELWH